MSCTVDARVDLSVDIAGVKLKNPVMVASGTFGFGTDTQLTWMCLAWVRLSQKA